MEGVEIIFLYDLENIIYQGRESIKGWSRQGRKLFAHQFNMRHRPPEGSFFFFRENPEGCQKEKRTFAQVRTMSKENQFNFYSCSWRDPSKSQGKGGRLRWKFHLSHFQLSRDAIKVGCKLTGQLIFPPPGAQAITTDIYILPKPPEENLLWNSPLMKSFGEFLMTLFFTRCSF